VDGRLARGPRQAREEARRRRREGDAVETLAAIFHALLALDQTLALLAAQYGPWLYVLLFLVIFAETGLVVFPLLPGDSILFIAGTVVAGAGLDVHLLVAVLIAAAILGDSVNYSIGHYIGPKVYDRPDSRWFRQSHLRRTQEFYDKYGGVTIIIGRFVPIVRTFAPFLAGVAGMSYRRFLSFNVIGAVAWIASLVYAGYLFGNIPWVKDNLTLIVVAIVVVSLLPAASTFLQEWRARKR
jgi:membrane-associated protein